MVFGTPITFTPSFWSPCAIFREPSPPMTIRASSPMSFMFLTTVLDSSLTISLPSTTFLTAKGLPLFVVPRIVPPRNSMPRVFQGVSSLALTGVSSPSKPSNIPTTSQLYLLTAVFTTARITALSPGASPPPESMPIFIHASVFLSLPKRSPDYADRFYE